MISGRFWLIWIRGLADWVDGQVEKGKFRDRSDLIGCAVAHYKREQDK